MPSPRVVSFTQIKAGGNFVTVTYEPPRLNRVGSVHALTLTREDRPPDADIGRIPALPRNPTGATE
jgi:hypothetical protein